MVSILNLKMTLFILAIIICLLSPANALDEECLEGAKYQYTQCDRDGNRWRVAVPENSDCLQDLNPYLVRGKKCNFECASGHYLDMADQECKICGAGTYSMGGGIRYDDWSTMPKGFSSKAERVLPRRPGFHRFNEDQEKKKKGDIKAKNCTGSWKAAGRYLIANDSECMISLEVEYEFMKEGWVAFEYQNADEAILFAFEIENERCEVEGSGGRNLGNTDEGKFSRKQFRVQPGTNRLIWTVLSVSVAGLDGGEGGGGGLRRFAKIRSIEVQGVAFTSECAACKAGSYSDKGASTCLPCPVNTHSPPSSYQCTPCDLSYQYAPLGSDRCFTKPPCTTNDYFQSLLPCNENNMTRHTYSWNEESICNINLTSSIHLPPPSIPIPCPPCNPGNQMVNGRCSFCPPNEFSSGSPPCKQCPFSTSPSMGFFIRSFPNANLSIYNITSRCISSMGIDEDCSVREGWKVGGEEMRSVDGNHPSSFLLLNMRVTGFRDTHKNEDAYDDEDDVDEGGGAIRVRRIRSGGDDDGDDDDDDEGSKIRVRRIRSGGDDGGDGRNNIMDSKYGNRRKVDENDGTDRDDDKDGDGTSKGSSSDDRDGNGNSGGGYKGDNKYKKGDDFKSRATPLAYISFVFELNCVDDCVLHFIRKVKREPLKVVEQWTGNTQKQKFTLPIFSTKPVTFSWTFQKKSESTPPSSSSSSPPSLLALALENSGQFSDKNEARLFSINVTNTLQGGASECEFCPQGTDIDGCIPCPQGHYIEASSKSCKQCQGNTAVKGGGSSWGVASCGQCGEGLTHVNHQACVTDCSYHSAMRNKTFDFKALAGIRTIESTHLFTTGGFKYMHLFNISLCSNHLSNPAHPLATCVSNLTVVDEDSEHGPPPSFSSPICRITSLPSSAGKPQLLNPLNFGDQLLAVTDNPSPHVINLLKQAKYYNNPNVTTPDVYFIYKSDLITKACKKGRTSVVILRCSSEKEERLSLPPHCPDGTCDGCNLVLLWPSRSGCPVCEEGDFSLYREDCENGTRQIIKQPITKECYIQSGTALRHAENCTVFWFFKSSSSIWLKVAAVMVPVFTLAGFVSVIVLLVCWRRNKKLEYKYMQLIESNAFTSRDSLELPGVDSCGLEENEEEDNFDAVQFTSKNKLPNKPKFFSRLRQGGGDNSSSMKRGYFENNDKEERMTLT